MSNPYRSESITGIANDEFKAVLALGTLKVRALYLQIGGGHIDQCLERIGLSMSEGHDSFRRYLAQETADYAARCDDPALTTPKRERPALNARDALHLAAKTIELLEAKRRLALQAVRMANNGMEPAREFIDAARESFAREVEVAARVAAKAAPIPPAPKPVKAEGEEKAPAVTPAVAAA